MTSHAINQFSFKATKRNHNRNLEEAVNYINSLPNDITIICENHQQISSNKFLLSVLSPTLRQIFSDPFPPSTTLHLPDFSSVSVKQFLNIISKGFTNSSKASYRDIAEVIDIARTLSVNITSLGEEINNALEEEAVVYLPIKVEQETDKLSDVIEQPEIFNNDKSGSENLKEVLPSFEDFEFELDNGDLDVQLDEEILKEDGDGNLTNEKIVGKRTFEQIFGIKEEYLTDEQKLEMRKEHRKDQKRRRAQSLTPAEKQNRDAARKQNVYLDFLEYCFSRPDVHIDQMLPKNEWENVFFKKYEDTQIYTFFHDFFWFKRVNRKGHGDGSNVANAKPKRATAEWMRSQIKMTLIQQHNVNIADPIKFPNQSADWQRILDMLNSPEEEVEIVPETQQHACDQCAYIAKESRLLKRHIELVHLKVRYLCNKCGYEAYPKYKLKQHIESGCEKYSNKKIGKSDPKERAYTDFLKYCFSRPDVHIDATLSQVEQENQLFEKYDHNNIYACFNEYFWSMKVNQKQDGSSMRPKKKTAEWTKSQIKMGILKKHQINLVDPVKFPNHKLDWAAYISTLDS